MFVDNIIIPHSAMRRFDQELAFSIIFVYVVVVTTHPWTIFELIINQAVKMTPNN